ncbi:hypothetical protein T4E_2923 [Trichinella pseudospiralis]|uniref:Uncharacterized protein n=1 Tax=Trichinella pseudospiralis TaxID=6337 RepID=A0A0V0Y649_TRIPS|nr:hypothetical protein T4E_2923 [Trichinella pseudospiralis]
MEWLRNSMNIEKQRLKQSYEWQIVGPVLPSTEPAFNNFIADIEKWSKKGSPKMTIRAWCHYPEISKEDRTSVEMLTEKLICPDEAFRLFLHVRKRERKKEEKALLRSSNPVRCENCKLNLVKRMTSVENMSKVDSAAFDDSFQC